MTEPHQPQAAYDHHQRHPHIRSEGKDEIAVPCNCNRHENDLYQDGTDRCVSDLSSNCCFL